MHPLIRQGNGGCRGSWWDKYLTRKLTKIGYFANIAINVEIMEFGSALFFKSYTVPWETHSNSTIIRSIKSLEERKNAKFESKLD
jgi:hypothetical protein